MVAATCTLAAVIDVKPFVHDLLRSGFASRAFVCRLAELFAALPGFEAAAAPAARAPRVRLRQLESGLLLNLSRGAG